MGSGKESLKVMAQFLRLFRNESLEFHCVDSVVKHKFVEENEGSDKQYEFVCENDLIEILRNDRVDDALYNDFLEALEFNVPAAHKIDEEVVQK